MPHPPSAAVAPVEYAVAVDRYLAEAGLGAASCRVYRISLTSWAWPLVGKLPPPGRSRRLASPPVVPLALLDSSDARVGVAAAVSYRAASAQARTLNRELSALRSAVGWWQRRHWIEGDPTAELRPMRARRVALTAPTSAPRAAPRPSARATPLFQGPVGLPGQALWRLLQDTGASAQALLRLDAGSVDVAGR